MSVPTILPVLSRVLALLATGVIASSCTSTTETSLLRSTIQVYGSDGQALPGARVVVMTSYLAPNELVWDHRTDDRGVATLVARTPGTAAAQASVGRQARYWMWCVERGGYLPVAGTQAREQEMVNVHVRLVKGYTSVRCDPSDRFAHIGFWQERLANGRDSGNMPERTGWVASGERQREAQERMPHPFGQPVPGQLKLHVISLANQSTNVREVDVSVADATSEHVLVLLSGRPVRWKLSIAEGTVVRDVLFFSGNKQRDNSSFASLPAGLVPIEARLPMPIQRYGRDERFGTIQLRGDYVALSEKLLARYGVAITTFQSAVSQTAFMIR